MAKEIDPVAELALLVRQHGNQRDAAEALGVTQQYLNDMLKSRRPVSQKIMSALGLTRQVRVTREKSA